MKVMKTLKSFKFWSKTSKKKKKKITTVHHHSPPPCCCSHMYHHHHASLTFQPSAPPLPSWLAYEQQTYNQHLLASEVKFTALPVSFDLQEHDIINTQPVVNPSSPSGDVESGYSYQQYMVENPTYWVPLRETERSAGAVGCVFSVGAHLFRCFFPCFRIRDAQNSFNV